MKAELVMITPSMATKWLDDHNQGNFRVIHNDRIVAYSNDITAGNWESNGATIVFDLDGDLLDGQHRLAAIVHADISVQMLVVTDSPATAQRVDRGKPRSVAQWLSHKGIKNAAVVAAVARLCLMHERGMWSRVSANKRDVSDDHIIDFAMRHRNSMANDKAIKISGLSGAMIHAVVFIGSGYRGYEANEVTKWFVESLRSGANLNETDAVFHLRSILMLKRATLHVTYFMARMMTTKAWNKTAKGEACTKNSVRLLGTGPDKSRLPNSVLIANSLQ